MDCSTLSPWLIDLLNFSLTFIAYVPAAITALLFYGELDKRISAKYPGIDNQNMRTSKSIPAILLAITLYFLIWYILLLLTKGFRCIGS